MILPACRPRCGQTSSSPAYLWALVLRSPPLRGQCFTPPPLPPVVAALSPLTLPAAWRSAMEGLLVRNGGVRRLSACTLIVEAIALAAGLTALWRGSGLWALVIHKWTQLLCEAIGYHLAARWKVQFTWSRTTSIAMFRFGHGIFVSRLMAYLQNYGVDLILAYCSIPPPLHLTASPCAW
ncbi:MAG: oligosaccharide flippase family protein [Alphaproteobacteria bacterium]